MKTEDIVLYGALAVGAYLLLTGNSSASSSTTALAPGATAATTSPLSSLLSIPQNLISSLSTPASTTISSSIPPAPATFDINYYLTYQYPVMLAQDPSIGNPNYIMGDSGAQQYINNYADLQGANLQSWPGGLTKAGVRDSLPQGQTGILDKARLHWTQYGVAQKRSFLPFTPYNNSPQVGVPIPPVPVAKSTGGFLGTLASLAQIAVPIVTAVAGTGDMVQVPLLTAEEVAVLVTGGQIVLDTLPLYFNSPSNGAAANEMYDDFENLIAQYV